MWPHRDSRSPTHLFTCSSILSSQHLDRHSSFPPSIRSFHPSIYRTIHPSMPPSIRPSIHTSIYPSPLIYPSVHPSICSFIHSYVTPHAATDPAIHASSVQRARQPPTVHQSVHSLVHPPICSHTDAVMHHSPNLPVPHLSHSFTPSSVLVPPTRPPTPLWAQLLPPAPPRADTHLLARYPPGSLLLLHILLTPAPATCPCSGPPVHRLCPCPGVCLSGLPSNTTGLLEALQERPPPGPSLPAVLGLWTHSASFRHHIAFSVRLRVPSCPCKDSTSDLLSR